MCLYREGFYISVVFGLLCLCMPVLADDSISGNDDIFAVVGQEKITAETFLSELSKGVREKFFHGKVTEKEINNYKQEVVTEMINRSLLLQEAKRRQIKISNELMQKRIDAETESFRKQEAWATQKDSILKAIKEKIKPELLIESLEQVVQEQSPATLAEMQEYYNKNLDKFTAPEQWNISLILLKVAPSSAAEVWRDTMDKATDIVAKIRNGGSFEELARIHSGDDSAINGGNMGYIHTGMLSIPAQQVLNQMKAGEISDPVMILQGIAIFRLNDIQTKRLNDFDSVKYKIEPLLNREKGDKAWKDLIASLRANSDININEQLLEQAGKDLIKR